MRFYCLTCLHKTQTVNYKEKGKYCYARCPKCGVILKTKKSRALDNEVTQLKKDCEICGKTKASLIFQGRFMCRQCRVEENSQDMKGGAN